MVEPNKLGGGVESENTNRLTDRAKQQAITRLADQDQDQELRIKEDQSPGVVVREKDETAEPKHVIGITDVQGALGILELPLDSLVLKSESTQPTGSDQKECHAERLDLLNDQQKSFEVLAEKFNDVQVSAKEIGGNADD